MTIDLNRRLHDTRKPGTEAPAEVDRRRRAALMAKQGAGFHQAKGHDFLQPGEAVVARVNPNGSTLSDLVTLKRKSDPEMDDRSRRMDKIAPEIQAIRGANFSLEEMEALDFVLRASRAVGGEPIAVPRGTLAQAIGVTPSEAEALLHSLVAAGHLTASRSLSGPIRYRPVFSR